MYSQTTPTLLIIIFVYNQAAYIKFVKFPHARKLSVDCPTKKLFAFQIWWYMLTEIKEKKKPEL